MVRGSVFTSPWSSDCTKNIPYKSSASLKYFQTLRTRSQTLTTTSSHGLGSFYCYNRTLLRHISSPSRHYSLASLHDGIFHYPSRQVQACMPHANVYRQHKLPHKVVACTMCDAANNKGDSVYLGAVKGVTQGGDARENLLHSLVEGCHCVVAALPQQHALHTNAATSAPAQCYKDFNKNSNKEGTNIQKAAL